MEKNLDKHVKKEKGDGGDEKAEHLSTEKQGIKSNTLH